MKQVIHEFFYTIIYNGFRLLLNAWICSHRAVLQRVSLVIFWLLFVSLMYLLPRDLAFVITCHLLFLLFVNHTLQFHALLFVLG